MGQARTQASHSTHRPAWWKMRMMWKIDTSVSSVPTPIHAGLFCSAKHSLQ